MDALQMHEGRIRDCRLSAATHVQCVDVLQMHEGRIRDCRLSAVTHVQRMNASQMHESRIRDCGLDAAAHGTNSAEENEIVVIQITSIDDICCRGTRKTSALHFQATVSVSCHR
jgi:hypothetical protein